MCPRCSCENETGDHLLLDYPFTRAVWPGSSLHYSPPLDFTPTVAGWLGSWDVVFRQDKRLGREALSKAAFLCWYLWRARNELCFNSISWTPSEVISFADKAYLEYAKVEKPAGHLNSPQVAGRDSAPLVWIAPLLGFFKINCDVALPQENVKGGLGLVLRDHAGVPMKFVSILMFFDSALQGELLVVRTALRLTLELGFSQIQVETDCREAVNYMLNQSGSPPCNSAVLISDIWKLSSSFSSVSFLFISRATNGAADALARKALSFVCLID
ncbi:uncharacterized protein LOC122650950 [Telopea speciosissima]|uniref:uncharacterized protein LOC122650950 n=1 Tax=Telopea speciosissima TaxID=54955 RepID=UPI001CC3EADB|nr:uncharacterized protein LOC122650950 [Telopea speciosissima]